MSRNFKSSNTNSTKAKGKTNYRGKRSLATAESVDYKLKSGNDPAWYSNDAQLLKDAASIPFSWALGTPITRNNPLYQTGTVYSRRSLDSDFIPGICSLRLSPSVGRSDGPQSPINIAAFQTYAFVRHANSGHSNYDPTDFMLMLTAMGQIYSYINWLQRIYGCITLYAQKNRYLPTAVLTAQHVDALDLNSNIANFRYGINMLINKAASFAVPASMPYYNRMAFLYQNIYTEGDSIKDQLYMYTPDGFWSYSAFESDIPGSLTFRDLRAEYPTLMTTKNLLDFGDSLISVLIKDEDINIMSGDILKAFGQENIIKLQTLPTEYTLIPVFNLAVLEQMKNTKAVGDLISKSGSLAMSSLGVYQSPDASYLVHMPRVQNSGSSLPEKRSMHVGMSALCENKILTTLIADVSPETVIENTRLMATGTHYSFNPNTGDVSVDITGGTELCSWVEIWDRGYEEVGPGLVDIVDFSYTYRYGETLYGPDLMTEPVEGFRSLLPSLLASCNFKYRPEMRTTLVISEASTGPASYETYTSFDVDNYAVLSTQDLEKMHETALLSLFRVPSIARLR